MKLELTLYDVRRTDVRLLQLTVSVRTTQVLLALDEISVSFLDGFVGVQHTLDIYGSYNNASLLAT